MSKYDPKLMSRFIEKNLKHDLVTNAAVFNTLRILKGKNPGDTYYEEYLKHLARRPDNFFDYYHLLWKIGSRWRMDNIMEIGCRTGISICQFLSAMPDTRVPEVFLFDVFNDGFISPSLVKMNMRALNLPQDKVHFIVGDSLETVPRFIDEQFRLMDYILVDGNHDKSAARKDLENVLSLLAPAGLLFFDDIAPDGCDLLDVWDAFKKDHSEEFYFHENLDGKGIGVGVKR
jgi:SAM-dependent methyltransferase